MPNIHEVTTINYHRVSSLRFGSSRDTFNVIWKYCILSSNYIEPFNSQSFLCLFSLRWRRMIMNTMKPDNVSILIQSCDSGLTAFITRSASPTCCFRPFGDLVTFNMLNIHVVTTINYHRVSHSRFGSSRDTFNVIWKYFIWSSNYISLNSLSDFDNFLS